VEKFPFRRPLGLVLAGGGALGAWQAGCLSALTRWGLRFDKIVGFSAGALCGAAYFVNRMSVVLQQWRGIDQMRVLRFKPRANPWTLFSGDAIWDAVRYTKNEELVKKRARCEFTVITYDRERHIPVYSSFGPGGRPWDGPLADKLVASCSIPHVFPPVTIRGRDYLDGGVPGREGLDFRALAGCRDVLVLEMVRPEEVHRRRLWDLASRVEQEGRELVLRQMDEGIESLLKLDEPPRVYRYFPSQSLNFSPLRFKSKFCAPAADQGVHDAGVLLTDPERWRWAGEPAVKEPVSAAGRWLRLPEMPGYAYGLMAGGLAVAGAGALFLHLRRLSDQDPKAKSNLH